LTSQRAEKFKEQVKKMAGNQQRVERLLMDLFG
jgi:hypothetical protein